MKAGDIFTWKKTFTNEDVLEFGRISGDQGRHHVEPDEKGRLMVQGLFTASIAIKIGGDLKYIAREINNEFVRPVFTGGTITCDSMKAFHRHSELHRQKPNRELYFFIFHERNSIFMKKMDGTQKDGS